MQYTDCVLFDNIYWHFIEVERIKFLLFITGVSCNSMHSISKERYILLRELETCNNETGMQNPKSHNAVLLPYKSAAEENHYMCSVHQPEQVNCWH